MPDRVTMSMPAMLRAWRQLGSDSLWVRVQAKGDPDALMAAAGTAMGAANDVEWRATDGAPRVGGSALSLTPRGPVVFVGFCESAAALQEWLTRFVAELSGLALVGKVTAVRSESAPIDYDQAVTLAAALSVPVDWDWVCRDAAVMNGATPDWYVDPDTTARLLDTLVPWCLYEGGRVFLRHRVMQVRIEAGQAREFVAAALGREPAVVLTCATGATDFHRVDIDRVGRITLSRARTGGTWRDDVASLQQPLIDVAPWLEQGLVRHASLGPGNWTGVVNMDAPLPPYTCTGPGAALLEVRHLAAHRAHDAYGIQVLTDEHLAQAGDLSGWDTQTVAPGRHLVRAHDLTPWYATDQPDPETLTRARTDFGDLILTDHIVAREPPAPC